MGSYFGRDPKPKPNKIIHVGLRLTSLNPTYEAVFGVASLKMGGGMSVLRGVVGGILILSSSIALADACPLSGSPAFTKALTQSKDRVRELPGYGCVNDVELAGTLPIAPSSGLFYWFVESERHDANTPVVLWLNGGPGSSSLYGFFLEHGPYVVRKDLTLEKRQKSWTKKAHYLVIDQPAGVGFSHGTKDVFVNESEAMDQLYAALQGFYARYPELLSHPLYIAGQSYAGKYIPQLAMRIIKRNKTSPRIPLQVILIGDGWVNPLVQQSSDAEFAYSHGLVDENTREKIRKLYQACAQEIKRHAPSTRLAHRRCGEMQDLIKQSSGCDHLTNIGTCQEPDDHAMTAYLNQPRVRQALHVDPRAKAYSTYDSTVAERLMVGEQD
jgi:carboxypeptidase C (cathepsin A)